GDRPMVIGLGQLGRSLVIAAAQRWAQDSFATQGPLRLTVIDRSASGRWHALRMQHPAIAEVCEPILLDLDMDAPSAEAVDGLLEMLRTDPPTWAAVAFEEESLALSAALLLHQAMRPRSMPIVVRTKSAAGLASLLGSSPSKAKSKTAAPAVVFQTAAPVRSPARRTPAEKRTAAKANAAKATAAKATAAKASAMPLTVDLAKASAATSPFPGMTTFPFLDRTCSAEAVDAGLREQLARGLHEDYLARADTGSSMGRPWADLADAERESSRQQVDGILETLSQLSCELIPLRRWGAPTTVFTAREVKTIARRDHDRWLADRRAAGWTHGARRDDQAKRNPLLVEWADLPDSAQSINVGAAESLPALLARAGFEPVRV
ncbi:MAG: hypothetical protein JWN61_284, partial [Pseudonocardiales bacterium]|nr:hypothetical protein [Pseudonocardiales bacterium]